MQQVIAAIQRLSRRDDGQDLLEYGLLVTVIALLAIGAVTTLGQTIFDTFWVRIGSASF